MIKLAMVLIGLGLSLLAAAVLKARKDHKPLQ